MINTQRGKRVITHEGYMYVFDGMSADSSKKFFRCRRRDIKCKARIHVGLDNVVQKTTGEHCHESSAAKIEVSSMITSVKTRAAETQEFPSVVINHCINNLSIAAQGVSPNNKAVKMSIRRLQRKNEMAPPIPQNLTELELPEQYKEYEVEEGVIENFLLGDSGQHEERILIFGRHLGLDILSTSDTWYVDGTCKITPTLFGQVLVIMGLGNMDMHPCVYILLPDKQQNTYVRMLQMLIKLKPQLAPTKISVDFEVAIHNAFRECFPNVNIDGCFFHLVNNLKKSVAQEGLLKEYHSNALLALNVRMITALAFVPPNQLDESFDALFDHLPESILAVGNWFERYFMGERYRRGGGRRRPMFPPETWNLYDRTINNDQRTNNIAEAAHRKLQSQLNIERPTIWRFITELKKVQKNRELFFERLVAGNPPAKTHKKCILADEQILTLVNDFENRDILEYLRSLAHNFEMLEA